jgi:hypothetical protein
MDSTAQLQDIFDRKLLRWCCQYRLQVVVTLSPRVRMPVVAVMVMMTGTQSDVQDALNQVAAPTSRGTAFRASDGRNTGGWTRNNVVLSHSVVIVMMMVVVVVVHIRMMSVRVVVRQRERLRTARHRKDIVFVVFHGNDSDFLSRTRAVAVERRRWNRLLRIAIFE